MAIISLTLYVQKYLKPHQNYFKHAGVAVIRGGWNKFDPYIFFRIGPTKKRTNVSISHNHADYLSFV